MDLREITKVLVKLVGLYFMTMVITIIPNILLSAKESMVTAAAYVSFGVWGVAGLAFLLFPGVIIDRVIRIRALAPAADTSRPNLLGIGIQLLGCYYAVGAIYGAAFSWSRNHIFNGSISPAMRPEDDAAFAASVLQIAAGLILWIFGDAISRFLERIQIAR